MSAVLTDQNTPTPSTDRAVNGAVGLASLAAAAEDNPTVKADLQAQFATYSHNPLVMGVTSIVGMMLTRKNITVDNTILTVIVGLVMTGVGYAYQWISLRITKKPVTIISGTKT